MSGLLPLPPGAVPLVGVPPGPFVATAAPPFPLLVRVDSALPPSLAAVVFYASNDVDGRWQPLLEGVLLESYAQVAAPGSAVDQAFAASVCAVYVSRLSEPFLYGVRVGETMTRGQYGDPNPVPTLYPRYWRYRIVDSPLIHHNPHLYETRGHTRFAATLVLQVAAARYLALTVLLLKD